MTTRLVLAMLPMTVGSTLAASCADATSETGEAADADADADNCSPLLARTGAIISVESSRAADVRSVIAGAANGATIVFAEGIYALDGDGILIDTADQAIDETRSHADIYGRPRWWPRTMGGGWVGMPGG